MSVIVEWFGKLYAVFSIVPVVTFVIIWVLFYVVSHNKKMATAWAIDITTVLFIGSVAVMFDYVFGSSSGLIMTILILVILGVLFGWLQIKTKGELNIRRLGRSVWRAGFAVLLIIYAALLISGISKSILAG